MARWDDIRRAILANDPDATEKLWMELMDAGTPDVPRFVDTAKLIAKQPGGRRQAGVLLWLLVDGLDNGGQAQATLPILKQLAETAPDDGTVREKAIEMVEKGWPEREDVEVLLERSQVKGGASAELAAQIAKLDSALQIEPDAYVFHKSGWGVGKIVGYDARRGRCVIDFRTRPGHEMDLEAAARILERLAEDDLRVQAMTDPKGLKKRAKEDPLTMLAQVAGWYGGAVALSNIKDALVPDAVATSTWSTWWKNARKQALLDPRIEISGTGRNARVEVHAIDQADFQTQVDKALRRADKIIDRQKVLRELARSVTGDEDASRIVEETVQREIGRSKDPAVHLGWELVLADLRGEEPEKRVSDMLAVADDPLAIVQSISDDRIRRTASKALLLARPGDRDQAATAAIAMDDPVLAEEVASDARTHEDQETLDLLVKAADGTPARTPNLYGWYLKEWRRGRFPDREHEVGALVQRMLKVIDAVEYRQRRKGSAKDKKAVSTLGDLLAEKKGALIQEAAEAVDTDAARNILQMIGEIRGLRGIVVGRLQDVVVRIHPDAAKSGRSDAEDEAPPTAATAQQIYMTADGLARMKASLASLEGDEMPATREEIARAREFGDLKENAEYHAAREKLSMLQAKADVLKGEMARAVVITPDIVADGAVSVGTRVRLRDDSGAVVHYTLFGPPDTDVDKGIINYMTPLGQALMGQSAGDTIRLEIEGQVRNLEVLGIERAV